MKRELPYDISYSRLKCWRKFENFALYVSIGCSLAVQTLQQLDGNCIIGFVQVLSFISLIMYGILFVVVEIFLQPVDRGFSDLKIQIMALQCDKNNRIRSA